jgi:hypothetical protein
VAQWERGECSDAVVHRLVKTKLTVIETHQQQRGNTLVVGGRRYRRVPRLAGEPFLASRAHQRLGKRSDVGIGHYRFVHVERTGAIGAAAQAYITKLHVVPGSAAAEIGDQGRAIQNAVHPELQ